MQENIDNLKIMFTQVLERVNFVNSENTFLRSILMQQPQYNTNSNAHPPAAPVQQILPMPQSRASLPLPQAQVQVQPQMQPQPQGQFGIQNFPSLPQPSFNDVNLNSVSSHLNHQISKGMNGFHNLM